MPQLPQPRRPEQVGGESTNVSNSSTYRSHLRKEKSDRRGLLLGRIVMVSGYTLIVGSGIAGLLILLFG
jgi:hypothetical protein